MKSAIGARGECLEFLGSLTNSSKANAAYALIHASVVAVSFRSIGGSRCSTSQFFEGGIQAERVPTLVARVVLPLIVRQVRERGLQALSFLCFNRQVVKLLCSQADAEGANKEESGSKCFHFVFFLFVSVY